MGDDVTRRLVEGRPEPEEDRGRRRGGERPVGRQLGSAGQPHDPAHGDLQRRLGDLAVALGAVAVADEEPGAVGEGGEEQPAPGHELAAVDVAAEGAGRDGVQADRAPGRAAPPARRRTGARGRRRPSGGAPRRRRRRSARCRWCRRGRAPPRSPPGRRSSRRGRRATPRARRPGGCTPPDGPRPRSARAPGGGRARCRRRPRSPLDRHHGRAEALVGVEPERCAGEGPDRERLAGRHRRHRRGGAVEHAGLDGLWGGDQLAHGGSGSGTTRVNHRRPAPGRAAHALRSCEISLSGAAAPASPWYKLDPMSTTSRPVRRSARGRVRSRSALVVRRPRSSSFVLASSGGSSCAATVLVVVSLGIWVGRAADRRATASRQMASRPRGSRLVLVVGQEWRVLSSDGSSRWNLEVDRLPLGRGRPVSHGLPRSGARAPRVVLVLPLRAAADRS